ncbi:cytochrome c biogenesis protein CcmG, thiol:disulfide interchange protein DsbE [Phyllobacterium sp. YR620]|uniref:DsbE family thiol:disulfide interchange protein n=1 Tax=Phyllobacterium sp. YR620 TaxID=1881066 RepID=UPI0008860F5A|nr:DsbE family thiol:disulfide interchange protein [Phyllobacterium sp. YR620]SDP38438.1 cytochrome c biogenesis protein CcmG, thiol:disulfide interchange protein DsbE [Phyllobacterium sp. YR620]
MSQQEGLQPPRAKRNSFFVFLPLIIFIGLAAIFAFQLASGRDESVIPSALIGKPAPALSLPAIPGLTRNGQPVGGLDPASFKGQVTLLNVFGSWCVPCRMEHPLLMKLGEDKRFQLAGLNYKDKAENALGFLRELGNPYAVVGADDSGRAAIEWGVYGVPETFLIGRDGNVAFKHVGPLSEKSIRDELMPAIEAALKANQ